MTYELYVLDCSIDSYIIIKLYVGILDACFRHS